MKQTVHNFFMVYTSLKQIKCNHFTTRPQEKPQKWPTNFESDVYTCHMLLGPRRPALRPCSALSEGDFSFVWRTLNQWDNFSVTRVHLLQSQVVNSMPIRPFVPEKRHSELLDLFVRLLGCKEDSVAMNINERICISRLLKLCKPCCRVRKPSEAGTSVRGFHQQLACTWS